MPTPPPEAQWMVHPDVVTNAIKLLVAVVSILGTVIVAIGGLAITLGVRIWNKHEKRQEDYEAKQDARWSEVSTSIGGLSSALSTVTSLFEHRMTAQETICKERGKHCPMYRRKGDREPEYEV